MALGVDKEAILELMENLPGDLFPDGWDMGRGCDGAAKGRGFVGVIAVHFFLVQGLVVAAELWFHPVVITLC